MLPLSLLSSPGLSICSFVTFFPYPLPVKEEHRVAFFGEDVHISVLTTTDVVFRPRVKDQAEVVLMQNGEVVHSRVKLNTQHSALILEDVGEEDEGLYVIKNTGASTHVKNLKLIVKGMKGST